MLSTIPQNARLATTRVTFARYTYNARKPYTPSRMLSMVPSEYRIQRGEFPNWANGSGVYAGSMNGPRTTIVAAVTTPDSATATMPRRSRPALSIAAHPFGGQSIPLAEVFVVR